MAVTLKQSRKIIGKSSEKYSDSELETLLTQFYSLAEVIADTVLTNGSKKNSIGIASASRKVENKDG